MLNNFTCCGRLVKDPEFKKVNGDISNVRFTLAVDRDVKKDGEYTTDFIDFVAWRNTAEFIQKYLVKGDMATVKGRLQFDKWTDDEGKNHKNAEILVENVYFMPKSKQAQAPAANPAPAPAPASYDAYEELSGDISALPF